MSSKNIPRLFIDKEFKLNAKIELNHNDKHYLKNVLRLYNGDVVKIFNGLDGEWKASFEREKNPFTKSNISINLRVIFLLEIHI